MLPGLGIEISPMSAEADGGWIPDQGVFGPDSSSNLFLTVVDSDDLYVDLSLWWSANESPTSGLRDYASVAAASGCYAYARPDVAGLSAGQPVGITGRIVRAAVILRDDLEGGRLEDCLFRGFVIALGLHLTERLAFDFQPLSEEERAEALAVLRLVHHPKVTPGMRRGDFFRLLRREGLIAPYFTAPRHEEHLLHSDLDRLAVPPALRWEEEITRHRRPPPRLPERVSRFPLSGDGDPVPLVVSSGLEVSLSAAIETLAPAIPWRGEPIFEVWHSGGNLQALAQAYRPGGRAVPNRPHILVAQMPAERDDRLKLWPNYLFAENNLNPDLVRFVQHGCTAYRAEPPGGGAVFLAAIVVDEALTPEEKEACLTLGLAQALGLNLREGKAFPALALDEPGKERLRLLLGMLYHPSIQPGMTRADLVQALQKSGVISLE